MKKQERLEGKVAGIILTGIGLLAAAYFALGLYELKEIEARAYEQVHRDYERPMYINK